MKNTKEILVENLVKPAHEYNNFSKIMERSIEQMKLSAYYKKKNVDPEESIKYFKSQLATTNKTDNYLNDWAKIRERIDNKLDNKNKEKINKIINNSKDTIEAFINGVKNKIIPMSLIRQMLILSANEKKLTVNSGGKDLTITFKDKKKEENFTEDEIETIKKVLISQNFFLSN